MGGQCQSITGVKVTEVERILLGSVTLLMRRLTLALIASVDYTQIISDAIKDTLSKQDN
jgi:hypothetical protein